MYGEEGGDIVMTPVFKSPMFVTVNSILTLSFNATFRTGFVGVTNKDATLTLCNG